MRQASTERKKPLPDFIIIGAAKAGTTSLADYLNQHSQIYISPSKEPNYFAFADVKLPKPGPARPEVLFSLLYLHSFTDFAAYCRQFEAAPEGTTRGEASVRYLYYPKAAQRIAECIPDVRLVAILREPVSRLYSHYCMNVQYQLEPLGLREAIAAEPARREAGWGWDWHYVNVSLYSSQIKRYLDLFGPEQLKVFLYDEFVKEPVRVIQEICRHVGVDDRFTPDMSKRGKVAYRARNLFLDRWLHWPCRSRRALERLMPRRVSGALWSRLEKWNSMPVPPIDRDMRSELTERFRDDTAALEDLLGRKISWYSR